MVKKANYETETSRAAIYLTSLITLLERAPVHAVTHGQEMVITAAINVDTPMRLREIRELLQRYADTSLPDAQVDRTPPPPVDLPPTSEDKWTQKSKRLSEAVSEAEGRRYSFHAGREQHRSSGDDQC